MNVCEELQSRLVDQSAGVLPYSGRGVRVVFRLRRAGVRKAVVELQGVGDRAEMARGVFIIGAPEKLSSPPISV